MGYCNGNYVLLLVTSSTLLVAAVSMAAPADVNPAAAAPTDKKGVNATLEEIYRQKAVKSLEESLRVYQPHPLDVTQNFNNIVAKTLEHGNFTNRRYLGEDECKATNPIDRCWRCNRHWASHRKRLADCVLGFGHLTTGGKHGRYYVVTDPSDDDMDRPKPGTLRHAVIQERPLWIIFKRSMVIRLKQELMITSNKTIDGRDYNFKDAIMQVTIAFNKFGNGLVQRMPRVRWGFAHVVNNDYYRWQLSAISGSTHPTIISQGNRFKADDNPSTKQVTKREYATDSEWMKWQWRSEGDEFKNGAYFVESGPPLDHANSQLIAHKTVKFLPGSYVGMLTKYAGTLKWKKGRYC